MDLSYFEFVFWAFPFNLVLFYKSGWHFIYGCFCCGETVGDFHISYLFYSILQNSGVILGLSKSV
jgi:hypothetical protein